MKHKLILLAFTAAALLSGAEYQISNIKLTLANPKYQAAYDELKYHLELAAGKLAPQQNALEIIIGKAGNKDVLQPQEACWLYKDGKLYIWGRDGKKGIPGTLFAVYGFLDSKLKVRWLYPGEEGVYIPETKNISFKDGETYRRTPHFIWGWLRKSNYSAVNQNPRMPKAWRFPEAAEKQITRDMASFTKRHRHGRITPINYGHAFVKWPERFSKTHMDYFGVSPYGKPGIPSMPKYAKLCLSNPAVIDQIIADWKAKGARKYLNICPNDGTAGFCHCEKCMALDVRKPGENFYAHLTDRYLNFWNRVAKRAIEINPEVMLVTYVYTFYRHPPRREKIEYPDNMLCGMVPILSEDSGALFEAWKAVGMRHSFLRPNDTHPASSLMRGMEKRIYDKYQAARKSFKLYGVDYDGTLGVKSRDLEHYVVARMIADPDLSFDTIIDEYCSAFGKAKDMVKNFYTTVRPIGEKMYFHSMKKNRKLLLDDSELESVVDQEYFSVFGNELKKLEAFPKNELTPVQKLRMTRLILTVKQSLLTAELFRQGDLAIAGKKNDFNNAAKALWDFRAANAAVMQENYGDIIRRTESKYWSRYQPYIDATSNSSVKLIDPAAGWRHSFDLPSMQGWKQRKAFKEITNAEASFDRYSIAAKPVLSKSEWVMFLPAVAVTPGAKYELSFDAKAVKGGDFTLRVANKSKTMKRIKISAKGNNWSQASGTLTIPKNLEKITLYVAIANAPEGGFIDNIILKRLEK